jgi:hypothetical protein
MGRYFEGSGDDDDVDPEAPTRRVRSASGQSGRGPADDLSDMTRGRRSSRVGGDEEDDGSPATTRFSRRRPGDEELEDEEEERPLPCGWLVIVSGPGTGHVASIENGMNIVGRGREAQIRIDFGDTGISREDHVRFSYDDSSREFHVIPGKGPITRLRGELVKEPRLLSRGDLVTIGGTQLRFVPFCDESFDWAEILAG